MTLLRLLKPVVAAVAALCLTACGGEAVVPGGSEPVYEVSLTLTTRADVSRDLVDEGPWGGDYMADPGTSFDRKITSVRAYLVSTAANQPMEVVELIKDPASDGEYKLFMEIRASSPMVSLGPDGNPRLNARLVTVANAPDMSSPYGLTGFTIPATAGTQSSDWCIPMWGVMQVSGITLSSESVTHLGTVSLLRSVAKVIVQLDDELKAKYRLKTVESYQSGVDLFRNQGLVVPNGARNVASTLGLMQEDCFNFMLGADFHAPFTLRAIDSKMVGYCADTYAPVSQLMRPLTMRVVLQPVHTGDPEVAGFIYFAKYNADRYTPGARFERLVRNHIYQFTLSLTDMKLQTDVAEWEFGGKVHIEI